MVKYIGGYLYPFTVIGPVDAEREGIEYEIVEEIKINSLNIIINNSGGLFTNLPDELIGKKEDENGHLIASHITKQEEFEQKVCTSFNHFACELCLHGVTSCVFSPAYLGIGMRDESHIWTKTACSSFSSAFERVIGPQYSINRERRVMAMFNNAIPIYCNARQLSLVSKLTNINESLPVFILSAYSQFQQHQLIEAIIVAWTACEQMINKLWTNHIDTIKASDRKDRLKDHRTYTASVRIELLHSMGVIGEELYDLLSKSRKLRNDIAHNAKVEIGNTYVSLLALHKMLEFILNEKVASPPAASGPLFSFDIERMG
jgi:hypothetical protein